MTGTVTKHQNRLLFTIMNLIVLVLSVLLIVFISADTFNNVNFLDNHVYMTFQLWVCIFFIIDFIVGLIYADHKWRYTGHQLFFLLLSIPYLNIINMLDIQLDFDTLYFVRFIPLARGALALSIVTGYVSDNAVTSLFLSYLLILLALCYFCSLIFYHYEFLVNASVNNYWDALWWSAMNLVTVGCDISPVTPEGKIVAVVLPISGIIIFPLFTVYLTDYVRRKSISNATLRDVQDTPMSPHKTEPSK